jgi:hypothetical protein
MNADASIAAEHAVRSHSLFLAVCGAMLAGGVSCGGKVVDLGDPRPPPYGFGRPRLLAELDTTFGTENPTLTADLLDLFFTSGRSDTNGDVWTAHRASPRDPFDPPTLVTDVSSPSHEASPAISLDGLTLYFGSDRDKLEGDVDIWSAVRADRGAPWSGFENLAALNSAVKDIPRPPGQHGLVMPMASERETTGDYKTYLTARPDVDQPFGAPAVISGLVPADVLADAFLSDDGLTMFYAAAVNGNKPDLFVAWRLTTDDRFSLPTPLTDLNTAADERDPWLSPDGTTFYFASDRGDGTLQIYEASASRQTP